LNDERNHPTYPSFERETFHFRQNIPEVAPENQPAQISGECLVIIQYFVVISSST
jgi:hypothetical protein